MMILSTSIRETELMSCLGIHVCVFMSCVCFWIRENFVFVLAVLDKYFLKSSKMHERSACQTKVTDSDEILM